MAHQNEENVKWQYYVDLYRHKDNTIHVVYLYTHHMHIDLLFANML